MFRISIKFPDYEIPENPKIMTFPKEWKTVEKQFDQNEPIKPKVIKMSALFTKMQFK